MVRETVQLLRLVVASPGDVVTERTAVESVAAELNRTIAADRMMHLEVVRWETDAYPGFHVDGPQGICDRVLEIEECDVLVGIFWTRFGKPTPDGMTGTEHEINKALSTWQKRRKPHVMVFFNMASPNPSLRSAAERRQWALVAEYREKFPAEGLFWEYEGTAQFEREFRRCMGNYLRQEFPAIQAKDLHPSDNALQSSNAGSDSSDAPVMLLFDKRIPKPQVPEILKLFGDFVRALGGLGVDVTELKLAAERESRAGQKNG